MTDDFDITGPEDFEGLAERLTLTDIVRLQDVLSKALTRRFEKKLGLAFSDVVGSTPYFARFGDEAGRKLQQRHFDLLSDAIAPHGGRVVDTAGDGAFVAFPDGTAAVRAMMELMEKLAKDNDARPSDHRLTLRIGCHSGPVLTDGAQVSGDSVNLCARVASSAGPGEVRLTTGAYTDLTDIPLRLRCRRVRDVELKGLKQPVDLFTLIWQDPLRFPSLVRFEDGSELPLPPQDVIRFGRLREQDGVAANDIVFNMADQHVLARISRWHFELHRRWQGFLLRSVTSAITEVDGRPVARGEEVPVLPGTKVRLGGVVTVEFGHARETVDATLMPT